MFFITLCSVPMPIAIPQPRSPQLTRFRFFLSDSSQANNCKQYRLHMGFFPTLAESQKWLTILRGTYPRAFVSEGSATQAQALSDTQNTRPALRDAVTRDAPVSFVVQLELSTQPIELRTAPRNAIFSSYTLYTTRANIEGQRWFCWRLGFFSEAISAKQVAQYLFSDFPSVAVVPVSPQEHATALAGGKRSTGADCSAQARSRSAGRQRRKI